MHKTQNLAHTKQKQQSFIKVLIWAATFLVLLFIIKQIAYPNSTYSNKTHSQTEAKSIQQHSDELNAEANELESTLDQLHFDEDIRALRNE